MLAFARLTPPGSRILNVSTPSQGVLAWAVQTPEHTINIVVTNVARRCSRVAIQVAGAKGRLPRRL